MSDEIYWSSGPGPTAVVRVPLPDSVVLPLGLAEWIGQGPTPGTHRSLLIWAYAEGDEPASPPPVPPPSLPSGPPPALPPAPVDPGGPRCIFGQGRFEADILDEILPTSSMRILRGNVRTDPARRIFVSYSVPEALSALRIDFMLTDPAVTDLLSTQVGTAACVGALVRAQLDPTAPSQEVEEAVGELWSMLRWNMATTPVVVRFAVIED